MCCIILKKYTIIKQKNFYNTTNLNNSYLTNLAIKIKI